MTAWSEPVWSYHGQFFNFDNCAIWPRPLQQPHPPVWIAARTSESIEWCVKHRHTIAQVYQTTSQIEDTFNYYREVAQGEGWQTGPEQCILTRHIYVDETDEKALKVAKPAMRYFFTLLNRGFNKGLSQKAGSQQRVRQALNTDRSFSYFREGNRERRDFSACSWEELNRTGFIIVGNPDKVAPKLNSQMGQVGADHFMGMFHIGNMDHRKVLSSLDLFHKEVMPQLESIKDIVSANQP